MLRLHFRFTRISVVTRISVSHAFLFHTHFCCHMHFISLYVYISPGWTEALLSVRQHLQCPEEHRKRIHAPLPAPRGAQPCREAWGRTLEDQPGSPEEWQSWGPAVVFFISELYPAP